MSVPVSPRSSTVLRTDWRFTKGNVPDAADPGFDDSGWETVRVPHDWAIAGPFARENDLQVATIWEDGERKPAEHCGRTGGLPHVGVAWYRRTLDIPAEAEGKRLFLEFDGVMSHSTVHVNGTEIGSWPFGYASFEFEITDCAQPGGTNVLAVRVDNKACASRWYPGAGIYRHVRLKVVAPVHVTHWGTCVTVPRIEDDTALVRVVTELENQSGAETDCVLRTDIVAPDGQTAATDETGVVLAGNLRTSQELQLATVQRWDIESPQLYRAVTTVSVAGEVVDRYETPFGIRECRFDANEGFFLNGRPLKLNGVCMHHDVGALGAAIAPRAIERQIEILKSMGCNAIRTSHNPPAPELLDLCDRMGMLVIDEAFDEWTVAKVDNGYHTLYDEWAEKDLAAMIHRDRNHPCVIMWSIGNEIGEQGREDGAKVAQFLTDICHREDPTRLVTAGFNNADGAVKNGLADAVDVPGWNYKCHLYQPYHDEHPEWIQYGSETESCVSSRGEYYFPVEEERNKTRETLHVSSYDMSAPGWGYQPDYEFAAQDDCPFILGEFVWTGFDYLGEPTPYKFEWPSRSSYFGIVDLCGFPKDRFYLYQSKWTDGPVLHLLPHWNWPGREGQVTPVHCYTTFESAELFLNGKSQGIRGKDPTAAMGRYRLIWDDVVYEPGELRVVGLDANGAPAAETVVRTTGAPARVELSADRCEICADGVDLSYITVRIVDERGDVCPLAGHMVRFTVDGPGEIAAVDNGDQTSVEPFQADHRKAFHGLCLLIVRSVDGEAGEIGITAEADGLGAGRAVVVTEQA